MSDASSVQNITLIVPWPGQPKENADNIEVVQQTTQNLQPKATF